MSFDQDPNEQANISGADLVILIDELKSTKEQLSAAQLCIEQMREALIDSQMHDIGKSQYERNKIAINLNPSLSALNEHDAKILEKLLDDADDSNWRNAAYSMIEALRNGKKGG